MPPTTSWQPETIHEPEFVVEHGITDTASTNLASGDTGFPSTATLGVVVTPLEDSEASSHVSRCAPAAHGFFAAAAVLGLGGVAIILVWHFCARDHDFIAALIGVAFCLAGWGLASRSFPHTTREYSTTPHGDDGRS